MSQALEILQQRFGYDQFRHQQQAIVETLIEGGDALVLMPTGGGKSLCYQIPALIRNGCAIVVSPLIALMQDQVNALELVGIRAAFINSSQTPEQQFQVRSELRCGQLDLLYVAPERITLPDFMDFLDDCEIALFAIDEAHCVSQWGHDFRPDYQKLFQLHERFPSVPRIALTATADQRTRLEIEQQLQLQDARQFIHSFDRPNIFYRISEAHNAKQQLWHFLSENHSDDAGIIYCLSRKQVEATADWLCSKGREALPYHAGLDSQTRSDHQERFLREDGLIIVATIAFGMGIDKPDVRFVAHLNLPKTIEAYYQETGRAGRDGQPANAWLAYGLKDIILLRQMSQSSEASEEYKRIVHHKLQALLGLCEQTSCRRQSLLAYFGENMPEPCGHCDNCVEPPQTWDATEAARKALSCVYRTGQRFGVNYLIDVLLGKNHARIQQNGHDKVSTFGIGEELNNNEWHSLFRQLIAQDYLISDIDQHGAIKLHPDCKPLLHGEQTLHLRKLVRPEKTRGEKKPRDKAAASDLRLVDQPLFEALRDHRRELADSQGVPPYVILHDKTLHELCRVRPQTLQALSAVHGIGSSKLNLYGDVLLEVIAEYPRDDSLDNNLSNTVNTTLSAFLSGESIELIAEQREIKTQTVYQHLSQAIEVGLLELSEVIKIDDDQLGDITSAIELCRLEDEFSMKQVYQSLDGRFDYPLLYCVRASLPQ